MPLGKSPAYGAAGVQRLFRALYTRHYRLFFGGQSVSLIGTWMQQVALSWWVYRHTHSALLLGIVSGAGQLPAFALAPFAGVLVDRWERHRLLLVTQTLAMLQALLLAALVLTDVATLWSIILLSALLGMVNALDIPTRQALIVDLVERSEDLGNAIALNASMINGARLVGPALAGLLIATVGEGICFLLNGLSYLAVLAALLALRLPPRPPAAPATPVLAGVREGVRYAWGFAPIRAMLLLLSAASLLGAPYQVLMPLFAADVLHGDAHTLGILTAASGVGAISGALYLASRQSVVGLGRILALSAGCFGLALVGFSLVRHMWGAVFALIWASGGMMVLTTSSNILLQTIVEEEKRGRVMSLYTMTYMGMAPLGSFLAGSVATQIGAPPTVRLGGLCCLIGALVFARHLPTLREIVRPLYVTRGFMHDAT